MKDGSSAKTPHRLHRGSAHCLCSLRGGCQAGEEGSVGDKEKVHVLGVVK